jgi:hypothetical protein
MVRGDSRAQERVVDVGVGVVAHLADAIAAKAQHGTRALVHDVRGRARQPAALANLDEHALVGLVPLAPPAVESAAEAPLEAQGETTAVRAFRRRFGAVVDFFKDLVGYYELDQENGEVHTLLMLLRGAVVSLAHYARQPDGDGISWDHPFAEVQYDVDVDLAAFEGKRHLNITHETFTPHDLDDRARIGRKVADAFLEHCIGYLLKSMTNDVLMVVGEQGTQPMFPQDVLEAVADLSPRRRRELLQKLMEPFCLGCTYLDERETRKPEMSRRAWKQLRAAADGQRITGSVALTIKPLVVDTIARRAYYPVTVGLGFDTGDPPDLSVEQQETFWTELVARLDDLITEHTTWDPSFFGKAEPWDRTDPRAQRAADRIKALADGLLDLETVPHREFEEFVAELYAGLGCRVRLTRASKDGGRDGIVEKLKPIAMRCIIECKHPNVDNKVEILPVRALFGVLNDDVPAPNKAMLVTSTAFASEGRQFESRHHWQLELIDARRLSRLARDYQAFQSE